MKRFLLAIVILFLATALPAAFDMVAPIGRFGKISVLIFPEPGCFDHARNVTAFSPPDLPFAVQRAIRLVCGSAEVLDDDVTFPTFVGPGEKLIFEFLFHPQTMGSFFTQAHLDYDPNIRLLINIAGHTRDGLCFYVDTSSFAGHAYVEFLPEIPELPTVSTPILGKYPGGFALWSNGAIRDDRTRLWTTRICYAVSPSEYRDAETLVLDELQSPGNYVLFTENCVSFAAATAGAANVGLPGFIGRVWIPDPKALEERLLQSGDLGRIGAGVVEVNLQTPEPYAEQVGYLSPEPIASQRIIVDGIAKGLVQELPPNMSYPWESPKEDARTPIMRSRPKAGQPYDYSIDAVVEGLHLNPEATAAEIQSPLTINDLGVVILSPGGILPFIFENFDTDTKFATIDWGDTPKFALEDLHRVTGSLLIDNHIYPTEGEFDGKVVVLAASGIYIYDFRVAVSQTVGKLGGGGFITVDIPEEPPVIRFNPGIPPENFPLPTPNLFFDGFESGDTSQWSSSVGI